MRYLVFLLIFALLIGFPAIGTAKASAIVTVSAPDQQIASGEKFTVSIDFNLDTAIAGAQFDLTFDPSIVTVDSVQKGDLLAPEEPVVYFDPGKIDNENGTISKVIGVVMTPGQTLPEKGSIAIITFTARGKDNNSPLNLSNIVLGNEEGQPVPVSILRNDEITVGVNHPPVLKIGNKSINQGQLLEFTITATDPDNDTLIYSASNLPPGARFDFKTRTFSWTPTQMETYAGVHFQVFDGEFVDSQDISITVSAPSDYIGSGVGGSTVTSGDSAVIVGGGAIGGGVPAGWGGVPPPVSGGGVAAVVGGSVIGTTGSGYCSDGTPCGWCSSTKPKECASEILVDNCSKCGCPPGLECQPDGTCSESAHTDDGDTSTGSDNFETNNTNNTATNTETNQAPVLDSIGNKSIDQGQQLQFTITAIDPNGDDLTYSASNLPSGANFDSQTGIFTWTPGSSQTGYFNVSFEVYDGQLSDSENITITVNEDQQYYVAINGNDSNPGSYQEPWRTIAKAANTAVAGDTVYVRSGTYRERIIPKNSGGPGNYITFSAYPNHKVIIDGSDHYFDYGNGLIHIEDKSYIKITEFTIHNSPNAGIAIKDNCDHITIENNYIYNCYSSGIWAGGVNDNANAAIVIDGNEVNRCCIGYSQECITLIGISGFEIKNNYVHDSPYPKEGIDVKVGCNNGLIHHNTVHGVRNGIYIDAWAQTSDNISIYNNLTYQCVDAGIAINAEQGGRLENIYIYNNVSHSNDHNGFIINYEASSYENIYLVNNTSANNGGLALQVTASGYKIDNLVVRNNIFDCTTKWGGVNFDTYDGGAQHHFDHNLYGCSPYLGTDYQTGDPGFVDPDSDFHLQSDSLAIDGGSSQDAPGDDFDDNSRPSGNAYDIGAYEVR